MKSKHYRILLIDHHCENRENLIELLELEGYHVFPSLNGEEGYHLSHSQIPDLIISDTRLPGINGFDLLRQLKAHPKTDQIPFLFLSAVSEKRMIQEGLQLGAMAYLVKPCCLEGLLKMVENITAVYA